MTSQTIDGVPRELLDKALLDAQRVRFATDKQVVELRALLDAEPAPCAKSQVEGKRERFQKWVMATKHPVFGFLDGRSLARGDDRTGYADEYVQGLWVAYLVFGVEQPAPVAVGLPERSNQDYAIEHAEYMAQSADEVLAKFQAYGLALLAVDEGGDDGEDELFENIDSARGDLQESLVGLRSMVYEFRKRSAKTR